MKWTYSSLYWHMNESIVTLALLIAYKVIALIAGLICVYLGYRLFCKGIFNEAGEMNASFSNNNLLVKKAAPGTFFALFGALVILSVIWRTVELPYEPKKGESAKNQAQLQVPDLGHRADSLNATIALRDSSVTNNRERVKTRRPDTTSNSNYYGLSDINRYSKREIIQFSPYEGEDAPSYDFYYLPRKRTLDSLHK